MSGMVIRLTGKDEAAVEEHEEATQDLEPGCSAAI